MIEMHGLTKAYRTADIETMALNNINVEVNAGEFIAIMGPSGCGKSTLARAMAGLTPALNGEVVLDGEVLPPGLRERKRDDLRKVQFVFQMADTALNPKQQIDEIIGRPIEFYLGLKGEEKRRRCPESPADSDRRTDNRPR